MSKEMWCDAYDRAKTNLYYQYGDVLGREPSGAEWDKYLKANEELLCKQAHEECEEDGDAE
jgi:hypothetical protein